MVSGDLLCKMDIVFPCPRERADVLQFPLSASPRSSCNWSGVIFVKSVFERTFRLNKSNVTVPDTNCHPRAGN